MDEFGARSHVIDPLVCTLPSTLVEGFMQGIPWLGGRICDGRVVVRGRTGWTMARSCILMRDVKHINAIDIVLKTLVKDQVKP